jgi:hypothetical protein
MPSVSKAQNRFVHAKANEGKKWAKKWVAHSRGQNVSKLPEKK